MDIELIDKYIPSSIIKKGTIIINPQRIPDTPKSKINTTISNIDEYEYIKIATILKTQQNGFILRKIATMHSTK